MVDRRHTHFSESDMATLAQFRHAKDGEWQKERQQTRPAQQLRPAMLITILFLAVLFCGLVLAIVSATIQTLWSEGAWGTSRIPRVCCPCRKFLLKFVQILLQVVIILVVVSGSNSDFVQKPVVEWDNADVMDWLTGLGDWASDQNISRVFLKEVRGRNIFVRHGDQEPECGVLKCC